MFVFPTVSELLFYRCCHPCIFREGSNSGRYNVNASAQAFRRHNPFSFFTENLLDRLPGIITFNQGRRGQWTGKIHWYLKFYNNVNWLKTLGTFVKF